jgi:hypothetical protein
MEWIILIFALGIAAYLYYYKRPIFDKHKGFIELSLIIFTALFTIYQVSSSTDDFNEIVDRMDSIITKAEESSESLHNLDSSLSKLPPQMDALSNSIKSFDEVISSQRDLLGATLNGLNGSILTFTSSIDSMAKRLNRKPDLYIDLSNYLTDSTRVINKIIITNRGKLLADVYRMRFLVDTNFVISFSPGREGGKYDNFVNYQYDLPSPAPIFEVDKPTNFDYDIVLKNESLTYLKIIVYYRASFGNDGTETKIFIFEKGKLRALKYP